MTIISMISEKGGVGKSTLAVNLAAEAARAGNKVLIVDMDNQKSATLFGNNRSTRADEANLAPITIVSHDGKDIKSLERLCSMYDLAVIDAPCKGHVPMRAALMLSDLAIAPFGPDDIELCTCATLIDILNEIKVVNRDLVAYSILNREYPDKPSVEAKNELRSLSEYGLPYLDVSIVRRKAFARAFTDGLSVVEAAIDAKAASECKYLYSKVIEILTKISEAA